MMWKVFYEKVRVSGMAETDNALKPPVTIGSLDGSYAPVSYDKEMISV